MLQACGPAPSVFCRGSWDLLPGVAQRTSSPCPSGYPLCGLLHHSRSRDALLLVSRHSVKFQKCFLFIKVWYFVMESSFTLICFPPRGSDWHFCICPCSGPALICPSGDGGGSKGGSLSRLSLTVWRVPPQRDTVLTTLSIYPCEIACLTFSHFIFLYLVLAV